MSASAPPFVAGDFVRFDHSHGSVGKVLSVEPNRVVVEWVYGRDNYGEVMVGRSVCRPKDLLRSTFELYAKVRDQKGFGADWQIEPTPLTAPAPPPSPAVPVQTAIDDGNFGNNTITLYASFGGALPRKVATMSMKDWMESSPVPRLQPLAWGMTFPDYRLSFDRLAAANVRRCEEVFHKLDRWTILEWLGALCGEAGEAANQAKKLRRLDDADCDIDTPEERERLADLIVEEERERLADLIVEELADVVIYADLAAALLRRELGQAIRAKFNKVSEERNSKERL